MALETPMSWKTYCRIMEIADRSSVHNFQVLVSPEMRSNNGRLIPAQYKRDQRGRATLRLTESLYKRARAAFPNATWT